MNPLEILLPELKGVKSSGDGGYVALCPSHDDKKNSLSINVAKNGTILLKCHANQGCTFKSIVEGAGLQEKDMFDKSNNKPVQKRIDVVYDYRNEEGEISYQVVKFKPKGFSQRRPDPDKPGKHIWSLKGVKPIPYQLPELMAQKPGDTVLICEGEKDCNNLRALGLVATTCSGGAGGWLKAHSLHLRGKRAVIIPDNDKPGKDHAQDIAHKLNGYAKDIRILELPDLKEHGDATDWIADQRRQGLTDKEILIEFVNLVKKLEFVKSGKAKPKIEVNSDVFKEAPFNFLGFNRGYYYFFPERSKQVSCYSSAQFQKLNLIELANMNWWRDKFGGPNGKIAWDFVANLLVDESLKFPTYNASNIRGCGAWYDNGKVVIHRGDHLWVDGKRVELSDFKSERIYEKNKAMEIIVSDPMSPDESEKLLDILELINWDKPIYSKLLAGWCVLAPISGALQWRPHLWLTSQMGAGKTWVVREIVKKLLGRTSLSIEGQTTQAGIRQFLQDNALPVVFDECEAESIEARRRLQEVLELMRLSSTESGGSIIKGTQGGTAVEYKIRSCFLLASIGVNINQSADASRITVISFKQHHIDVRKEKYEQLSITALDTFTPEYCAAFRSRAIKLIPVIRKNAEIFGSAIAGHLGNQRMGDQYGALLAGYCSLLSDDIIGLEDAKDIVEGQDWEEQSDIDNILGDEWRCLSYILQYVLQIRSDTRVLYDCSIEELVWMLYKGESNLDGLTTRDIEKALMRYGIRVFDHQLIIANSHVQLNKIMERSAWEMNWSGILSRINGSERKQSFRFGKSSLCRAVGIPISEVFKQAEEEEL